MDMKIAACLAVCVTLALVVADEYQQPNPCLLRCTRELDPVCAQNSEGEYKTFPNPCFLDYLNCRMGTDYQRVDDPSYCDALLPTEE